jgi:hypothetical protein
MIEQTIWKYPLRITDEVRISIPTGAQILSVQMQGDTACLWALVVPGQKEVERYFRIFGTGHPIPDISPYTFEFISTIQVHGGRLIFHVFERVFRGSAE